MRLAGVASRDVVLRRRFLMAPVPWDIGPDDRFLRCEEDAGRMGEAERDEFGEADSGEETSTVPFLATESDSIDSVSESSIASLGGDCGRFGGALIAVEAIEAASDDVKFGAVLDGLSLRAVGSLLVAVGATGTVSDNVALGAVGAFSIGTDTTGTVSEGLALGAVGAFPVIVDAVGAVSDGVAPGFVGAVSVLTDATITASDGVTL